MQKPFQQVKEISQYDSFHDAIIGTLSPIYGEREAQNIAKYMLPDLKDISTTQQEEILTGWRKVSRGNISSEKNLFMDWISLSIHIL